MNNVHGIAVDPTTRRVFVNDRGNHRVQVFDENGKFLDQWRFGDPPSDIHLLLITPDRHLWAADRGTNKILKYDLDGQFPLFVGNLGRFPRRILGRARNERRLGRQLLRRRGRQRTRAEISPARGRRSGRSSSAAGSSCAPNSTVTDSAFAPRSARNSPATRRGFRAPRASNDLQRTKMCVRPPRTRR